MTGLKTTIADGLQSLATRLGTASAKSNTASYVERVLDDNQIEAAFRTSWSIEKAVVIPSMDATRKWRQWSDGDVAKIEEAETVSRIKVRAKVREAHWKARLWGGAAILIGLRDGALDQPIDVGRVGKDDLEYLTVLTRHDLSSEITEQDPRQERFGKPKYYRLSTNTGEVITVHPSRLVIFDGKPLPRVGSSAQLNYGWGDSVLQRIYETCRNLDSTMSNMADLVFDAKTDVVKVPDLSKRISDQNYEAALLKRFSIARMLKGNQGTLILDGEEDYVSQTYSFSGLDKVSDRFMQVCAGASDIPMTRFFGMSPGGMNSSGESDLTNYHDMIQSLQTNEIQPELAILDQCLVRSTFGQWPEGLTYEWRPLRQMSESQVSEIRSRNAETITKLAASQIYEDEAVAKVGAQMFEEAGVDALGDAELGADTGDFEVSDAEPRSLYVHRKVLNGKDLIKWARKQGFSDTLTEDDLHVTIAFSRNPVDWMEMGTDWEAEITIPEGGPRIMEKFGDARVLLFSSSTLSWRHEDMKRNGATWDHANYQPHITISYENTSPELKDVEPYTGKIVLGPEVFAEINENWREEVEHT